MATKASKLLELSQQLRGKVNKFLKFLGSSYGLGKLSKKLEAFYNLSFNDFVKELKKQKVSLSKKDEFELMDLFEKQKARIFEIHHAIKATDKEINNMVYQLYELTENEIQLIEGVKVL